MGPGQYPQCTRAPKVGGGCGQLAKHYTYMSPITKRMEGPLPTFFTFINFVFEFFLFTFYFLLFLSYFLLFTFTLLLILCSFFFDKRGSETSDK